MVIELVGLYGHVVEVGAVADADFGSGVTDELGGYHPEDEADPLSQPNGALIFDTDRAVGVDAPFALTVPEFDPAADERHRSAQRPRGGPFAGA